MPISSITIRYNDGLYNFTFDFDGESILDAAFFEGISLPYSCKKGVCGTCRAKLLEGRVDTQVSASLSTEMIKQGWILTCQSHPTAEKMFIDFDAE